MSDDPRFITGEQSVFSTRKHWAALVVDSGWAILMLIGSVVLSWIQPDATTGVLGFFARIIELIRLGLFFGACFWFIYNVVAWRTAEYMVTNLRVLGHEGLIRRRSTDTLLSSLSDIRTTVPLFGSMLGYGNIRIISSSGEAGKDNFTGVHDAEGFKHQVLEQKAGLLARASSRAAAPASAATPPGAAQTTSGSWQDATQLLGQLANLRDAGLITQDEYEQKKSEILGRM
jgi:uncharacterized membrane protein YdbT with pleckstrin-like domain